MSGTQFDLFGGDSRADQIFKAFKAFHASNPEIWELFKKFSFQLLEAGREHYSAAAVFERIRWHLDVTTRGGDLKLNNNFRAYYARLFHVGFPQHDGFFRNRKRTSTDDPASDNDRQEFIGPPPGGEDLDLVRKLKDLL